MKSLKIAALALLLQFPLSHAGCDGYENTISDPRGETLGSFGAILAIGLGVTLAGGRQIYKAAQKITLNINPEAPEASLIPRNNNDVTFSKVKQGLFMMGCGTAAMVISVGMMATNESIARSNCCDGLPSNSTCDWNK